MGESVSFAQIPNNLRVPLFAVEFDNSQASAGQTVQRTLIVGDTYTTVPMALAYLPSGGAADGIYGPQSAMSAMVRAYQANDPLGEVWGVGMIHAGGATQAAATLSIAGTATATGTLSLYIGGTLVAQTVAAGDVSATIAGNLANTINALIGSALPAYVSNNNGEGTLTISSVLQGQIYNNIDLRLNFLGGPGGEQTPAGLTVSMSGFSGGTGTPDLSGLAGLLGDQNFDFIVVQYDDGSSLNAYQALMNNDSGRWAPLRQDYGHVWLVHQDSAADLLQYYGPGNDPHRDIFGVAASPTLPWVLNAATAGVCAQSLKADPALPLQTLQVQGVLAPAQTDQFTKTEQQALLSGGIACYSYDDGGNTYILRAVTNYTTNPYGLPDTSYLDVETLYTLMAITRQLAIAITTTFGRVKLADDGTTYGAGQAIVTPSVIAGEIAAQYSIMERNGLVEDAAAMILATVVTRNSTDPSRVDVLWAPYLVSGLRVVAVKNQFRLLSAAMLSVLTS